MYTFLVTILNTCVKSGRGNCLMTASAEVNTVVDSEMVDETSPQMIKPAERKGKNSWIGVSKRFPKIIPKQAIMTPVEMVIQKGPNDDLLYLWRMSAHARYKGSLIFLKDAYKSANPTPVAKLELLTFFMLKKLSLQVAYFTGDKDNILLVTNESRRAGSTHDINKKSE